MLTATKIQSVCLPCRLRILASCARSSQRRVNAQLSRSSEFLRVRAPNSSSHNIASRRAFTTTRSSQQQNLDPASDQSNPVEDLPSTPTDRVLIEATVRQARQLFGDALPRDHLNKEEYVVYERLYGIPVFVEKAEDLEEELEEVEVVEKELPDGSTVLLRKGEDGTLEEIEVDDKELVADEEDGDLEGDSSMTKEEWEDLKERNEENYHDEVYERSRAVQEEAEDEEDEDFMRAHPLTIAGRSKPSPSTVFLPKETFVDPTTELLTRANHKHLAESSKRIFGGNGLPNSTSTAAPFLGKKQEPIPLDPSQADMGNIEADAYLASVMPGAYATVMSTLVEVRRRLGTSWIEQLLKTKKGGMILDAGSGGAGVLAWHEILKAEWQRLHEESGAISQESSPLGKATILTGSDTLRHRASRLLENTTFIPRLPEGVPKEDDVNAQQPQKVYDLIIAPHTLWPLKQEYLRKDHVEKYWSLLNPKGGVLILIEKGLPRGFEVIAAAREHLLAKHIASPNSTQVEAPLEEQTSRPNDDTRFVQKETGMIIAPCTNHSACPMYQSPGASLGRKDYCYFSQRYIRPPYLQRILNAQDRNHEDVQFSYIAVQRGRDQRLAEHDLVGRGVTQDAHTTTLAFEGHEWKPSASADPDADPSTEPELTSPADINTLSLPRLVLPALKRRGHIILDVCTPAGTLERWTVPRSFSSQAFRDARKARWGDLWALGAKTRIPKNVRLGRPRDEFDRKGRRIRAPKKVVVEVGVGDEGEEVGSRIKETGRWAQERKIRGSGGRKGRRKRYELLD
ncbi:37S ribosomal protein-like protein Rsm22 [Massariosphaeria phaeospora]|uniref:37S ribosomal protein-like protein Rsm22 n=1 Tax=Massariosphaeria phaeospora TaxID=100035 RepID=A0A7C8I4Q3_9PLEO|nr:37S ribosomal protein-like protein Rsm22 [Massariosphaeria phaeospora]